MFYTYKNCKVKVDGRDVIVSDANLSVNSSIEPDYVAEQRQSFDYVPAGGIGGRLNFSYFPTGNDPISDHMENEEASLSGNFAGLSFESGFLSSYELSCEPNRAVRVNASLVFFDELKGAFSPTNEAATPEDKILNFRDATLSAVNNTVESITSARGISFSFVNEITPTYPVGSELPDRVSFGVKTISASINTDNYSGDMPIGGKAAGVKINFSHPNETGILLSLQCDGMLNQRSFSSSAGGPLVNSLNIVDNNTSPPPTVSSFVPASGCPGSGVYINGDDFTNAYKIIFNDIETSDFTIINDEQISGNIPLDAITGPISVVAHGGETASTGDFVIIQKPLIVDSFTPKTGLMEVTDVQIIGSNFYRISDVIFPQDVSSQNFSVNSENLITATVPNGAAYGTITVVSSERNISGVSTGVFAPVPQIDDFSPTEGIFGDSITVSGDGFSGMQAVYFNNIAAAFTVDSNTQITTTVPSGNSNGRIFMSGQCGVTATSLNDFQANISLTGIEGNPVYTGSVFDNVELNGLFIPELLFNTDTNKYKVDFNGATGEFTFVNDLSMTGDVPTGATTGPINLVRTDGTTLHPSSISFQQIAGPPVITSISPISGKPNQTVNVFGANLFDVSEVLLSGAVQTGVTGYLTNELGTLASFDLPDIVGGDYQVRITTPISQTPSGEQSVLYVMDDPTLTSFGPSSGFIGDTVTITGSNLYPQTKVYIGDWSTEAAGLGNNDDFTEFQFSIPQGVGGQQTILVDNYVSTGEIGLLNVLGSPFISGFDPITGEWGDTITLTGINLTDVNLVKVGGDSALNLTIVHDGRLTFDIPDGSDTDYVHVFNSLSSGSSSDQLVVFQAAIEISGFTPSTGEYQEEVTVSGKYMDTVDIITFSGDSEMVSYSALSLLNTQTEDRITFDIPFGLEDGAFSLSNDNHTTTTTEILYIEEAPAIAFVLPLTGAYLDELTITGSSLLNKKILFADPTGGTIVGINASLSATGGTVQVPKNIIPAAIQLSGDGSILQTMSTNFVPMPTITDFSPKNLASGHLITVNAVNALDMVAALYMSGYDGVITTILGSDEIFIDQSDVSGVSSPITGETVITGIVNGNYAGSGKLFLVAGDDILAQTALTFTQSYTYSRLQDVLSTDVLDISGSAPTITSFSPSRGNSNTLVTILGDSLSSVTGVAVVSGAFDFTGDIVEKSNSQITFYPSPEFSIRGFGDLRVVNQYGSSQQSSFTYIHTPDASGISPSNGSVGDVVRVEGFGLQDITGVYFGDTEASFTTFFDPSFGDWVVSGTVPNVPEALPYSYSITVMNEAGESTAQGTYQVNGTASELTKYQTPRADWEVWPTGSNVSVDFAHGLSQKPDMWQFYAHCISGELGYASGDEIVMPGGAFQVTAIYGTNGITTWVNETGLGAKGSWGDDWRIYNKAQDSTEDYQILTKNAWKLKAMAYYLP
jgi:hypothetical protein